MKKSEFLAMRFSTPTPNPTKPLYFKWNGEFRAPRKGEWYISGAVPQVYQAFNDLGTKFYIAIEVPAPQKTVVVDGFTYRLAQ
jgi:hypothetical protein